MSPGLALAITKGYFPAYRIFYTQKEWHCCARKLRHSDILSAFQHVKHLSRINKDNEKLVVYPCRYCLGLHIGKSKRFKNELMENQFSFVEL